MNFEYFIAKRIISKKQTGTFTRPIIRIAILSIILGLSVMIVSIAIVTGFQNEIRSKVIGFGSHIQVVNYDNNNSLETSPVNRNADFIETIKSNPEIKHIQVFGKKAGIIKTDDQIEGVILKGIDKDFDWSFFKDKIIEGAALEITDSVKSNDVMISKHLASKLKLKLDDDFLMYFIQDPPRMRKFRIIGIYETGLKELDEKFILGDIKHIQKLNNWDSSSVSGFEITIHDFDKLDEIAYFVYENIGYNLDTRSIKDLYPQIFDWLELQDMNVIIILALMILVAGINMISTLLILILERTNMIGILKAMGTQNWSVRKIFLYNATYLIGKGLLWGNIFGIAVCLIQKHFEVIKLPQDSYYVDTVPINFDWINFLFVNLGTLAICLLMLIIPSYIITRVTPVKAIRFN